MEETSIILLFEVCPPDFLFWFPVDLKKYGISLCRVHDIMRMDAEKDPATSEDAARARLLVNQVCCYWVLDS